MNRAEANNAAKKLWGGLAKVVRSSWFDNLAGKRLVEYRVGEVTDKGFEVYGTGDSWEEAFERAKSKKE